MAQEVKPGTKLTVENKTPASALLKEILFTTRNPEKTEQILNKVYDYQQKNKMIVLSKSEWLSEEKTLVFLYNLLETETNSEEIQNIYEKINFINTRLISYERIKDEINKN